MKDHLAVTSLSANHSRYCPCQYQGKRNNFLSYIYLPGRSAFHELKIDTLKADQTYFSGTPGKFSRVMRLEKSIY